MPKAKTGCDTVLYTKVTSEANDVLNDLVSHAQATSGWPVSRAVLIDTLIKRNRGKNMKIDRPSYSPHPRVPRITKATR